MNYLIYGIENFLIDEEIDKCLKKHKIDKMNVNKYDALVDSISTVIDDCNSYSLFSDNKCIIVDNCNLFNRVKTNDKDIELVMEYLTNYNPNTFLIFISRNESIDNTKKITKLIKEKGHTIECSPRNINDIIIKLFEPYKISNSSVKLLVDRVGNDLSILKQNIDKIKIYKDSDMNITDEDIKELTVSSMELDIFTFIDHIASRNKELALKDYQLFMYNNEEPTKIIIMVANKFRLMYQARELSRMGYSEQKIASELKVHAYPVKLAKQAGMRYTDTLLLSFIEKLSDLDLDIKTGKIDPYLGLELFILSI